MVYLIGVNHVLQYDSASHNLSKIVRNKGASFKAHVLEAIERFSISILAEEFSDEAKKKVGVSETTLEQMAKDKRIEPRFCTPGREEIWLSEIQDCKDKSVLFVCGDGHFESFAATLIAAGFDVQRGPRWDITEDEWRTINKEIWEAS
jgi:hypothetical protein